MHQQPQQGRSSFSNDKPTPISDDYAIDDDILDEIANSVSPPSAAMAASTVRPDFYSSFEHIGIGHEGFTAFFNDAVKQNTGIYLDLAERFDVHTHQLTLSSGLKITPGQIVALAGDFYGVPGQPISSPLDADARRARFIIAFRQLADTDEATFKNILAAIAPEFEALQEAYHEKTSLEAALKKREGKAGWSAYKRYVAASPSYAELLLDNYDHFQGDALKAHDAGYEEAIQTAIQAYAETNQQNKQNLLVDALAKELFACHFLSDYFASGHIRTPRRALYHYGSQNFGITRFGALAKSAGLAANSMHDEDNDEGLWLMSEAYPQGWKAYGDNKYYTLENQRNKEIITKIIGATLHDVYFAYRKGTRPAPSYKRYLPIMGEDGQPAAPPGHQNSLPLFKEEEGTVKLRRENPQPGEPLYETNWGLGKLESRGLGGASRVFSFFKSIPAGERLTQEQEDFLAEELKNLDVEIGHCACSGASHSKGP